MAQDTFNRIADKTMQWISGCLFAVTVAVPSLCLDVTNAAEFDACGIESAMAFDDWQAWAKTSPQPYYSHQHAKDWVSVYFDDLAAGSPLQSTGQFSECAKIVKVHFADASATAVRHLMLTRRALHPSLLPRPGPTPKTTAPPAFPRLARAE